MIGPTAISLRVRNSRRATCFFLASLFLHLAASFIPPCASAQVQPGTPPFGSYGGGPDIVNLGNLNTHLTIPVRHKPGRGTNFAYDLKYDGAVWYPITSGSTKSWQPVSQFGWSGLTATGYSTYKTISKSCRFFQETQWVTEYYQLYTAWVYHDSSGTAHPMPGGFQDGGALDCGPSESAVLQANDGSGYKLSEPDDTLYTREGLVGALGLNKTTDRNGNQITQNAGVYTDTLGTTALTVTGSGTPSSPYVFTYTAPSGASAQYKMIYTAQTVKTNFGCSGVTEYGPTVNNLVSEIDLPDGSKYLFTYEATPGPSGYVTGRPYQVTLPTGGVITYAYGAGNNGINCSDGSTATLTRTTPDGTWTYARTLVSGTQWQTIVTDPQANQTTAQFQFNLDSADNQTISQYFETQRVVNQGSSTTLLTTNTCYNGAASPCTGTTVTLPVMQRDTYTQLPGTANLVAKHTEKYTSYGMTSELDDYDYGSGSPGSLVKQSLITYASLGNNINAFPQQVTVKNGAGTILAQTTYNYDEASPTISSGTPQHIGVSGSRGNLTSVDYPAGSLVAHVTYYDTGTTNTVTDVNGATTTYNYPDATSTCGNTFPTSITEALNLSRSMTWNCTGGVQLTATDENGKTVTTAYSTDAYFWRPNAGTDQLGNQTSFFYQPNPSYCCPPMVASQMIFNNGTSEASDFQYKDSLGRTYVDQKQQAPNSSSADSVSYSYDANGRPYSVSMPCTIGWTQTCSTPKTTQTYDALNRPLQAVDAGGGTVTNYYAQNDVLVTISPAPSGENTKRRQLEYDGLGRLTSVCEVTGISGSGSCGQNNAQTGFLTKYTYDALGNLLTVTQNAQPGGTAQTRTYQYDAMSRLTSETNPESGTSTYTYDSANVGACTVTSKGDLIMRTNAAGVSTCNSYDALHRVVSVGHNPARANNTPDRFFVYDTATVNNAAMSNAKGRLAEAYTCLSPCTKLTDAGISYTVRGEISDLYESTPNSAGYYHSTATYYANGALNQLSSPNGWGYSASWNVDGEGRIASNYNTGVNPLSSTVYNAASQPTRLNFASGDNDSFTYDPNTGRMTQYKFTVGSTPQSLIGNLTWNPNGTLQTQNITDPFDGADTQNCAYGYDDLSRLGGANCGSAAAQTFTYDAFGNINKSGSPFSFQPTYSSTTNRMSVIGSFTPTYDANGNVTNDNSHTYTWSADGQPLTVDSVNLTYDAFGRMVEQNRSGSYTQFMYSPTGFKMQIMQGQNIQRSFVPLSGGSTALYTGNVLTYYHPDWLGNNRFVSTSSRTMSSDVAYAPFGETYASSGTTDPAFTTQRQDTVSGLYDFPARGYSIQGRWPSPDPAGLAAVDPTNPQSWNRYAYVVNNPLALTDPLGLVCSGNIGNTSDTPCNPGNSGGGGGSGLFSGGSGDPTGGYFSFLVILPGDSISYGISAIEGLDTADVIDPTDYINELVWIPGAIGNPSIGPPNWLWNAAKSFVKGWYTKGLSDQPGSCTAVFLNSVQGSAGSAARSIAGFTRTYGAALASGLAGAGPVAATSVSAMAAAGQLSPGVGAVATNVIAGTAPLAAAAAPYVVTVGGYFAIGGFDYLLGKGLIQELTAIKNGQCKP